MKRLLLPAILVSLTAAALAQEPVKPATINAADHPTLQAAFDALPASGGVVRIPPGNYEITTPLLIHTAETRIEGSGAATHIINQNTEGQPALLLKPTDAALAADPKAQLWRVQLADLRISGNEKSGDGLRAEFIQEIYLHGLSIDHHGGNGIHLVSCFEDPRVANNILTYNKDCGLRLFDCHDIVVSANHFEENQDALHCADAFNLCATGNNIDDHLRHGIVIENTYGSVVSGNMIEECNGTALILDRDCYGITLSANVIAHHLEGGIDLRDANGCNIAANTFTIAHRFSVRVGPGSGRHTISANTFCNTHIGDGKDKRPAEGKTPMSIDEGTGILLEGARHISITGNSFSGLSTAAVWTKGDCRSLLINANMLTDCGRKLDKKASWINVKTATPSIVKENLIDRAP
jgi:parallel beta-helix repeat protein